MIFLHFGFDIAIREFFTSAFAAAVDRFLEQVIMEESLACVFLTILKKVLKIEFSIFLNGENLELNSEAL